MAEHFETVERTLELAEELEGVTTDRDNTQTALEWAETELADKMRQLTASQVDVRRERDRADEAEHEARRKGAE